MSLPLECWSRKFAINCLNKGVSGENVSPSANDRSCGRDNMRPSDKLWSRLLRLRARNAELADAVIESCAVQAEARCGSRRTANHPMSVTQDTKNVFAFDGFEGRRSVTVICCFGRLLQLGEWYFETGTAR